ncbi:MAG: site-specific integrase [Clostridia bacterium]|nr:site-specific integrase [Clostridia bacterium]
MIYNKWLDEWLSAFVKPIVKARTFAQYNDILRLRVSPELGLYDMDELNVAVLQQFVAKMTEMYAPNTVTFILNVVKNSLTSAEKTGIVKRNFADCLQLPRPNEKKIECFSVAEQKKLEKFVFESEKPKLFGIVIGLYTGMRVGELMALEWNDIDLSRGTISITKTCHDLWQNGAYKKIIDTPKTQNSWRTIPVPKQLLPYLRRIKKQSGSAYVVSGANGKDVPIRSYQRTFELVLKNLKIPHRGFHALRHTFATRALECGMDVKTLSEILGHKNPTVTLKRYVHSLMEHKSAMMNKIAKTMNMGGDLNPEE